MNEAQGRKEVGQAVAIAALTTLANSLIAWGVDTAKKNAGAVTMKPIGEIGEATMIRHTRFTGHSTLCYTNRTLRMEWRSKSAVAD